MRGELAALGIEVASAHLPFKERYDGKERTSEWLRVSEAFGVLGGGFALCIQAVLIACDAGLVEHGERVVALTADTALEARACRTETFLSPLEGLLVSHIICKPGRYDISKRFHETIAPPTPAKRPTRVLETTSEALPALIEPTAERPLLRTGKSQRKPGGTSLASQKAAVRKAKGKRR